MQYVRGLRRGWSQRERGRCPLQDFSVADKPQYVCSRTVLQAHVLWSPSQLVNYPGREGIHLHWCHGISRANLMVSKALEKSKNISRRSVIQYQQSVVFRATGMWRLWLRREAWPSPTWRHDRDFDMTDICEIFLHCSQFLKYVSWPWSPKKKNKKNASSACWRVIVGVFSLLHVEHVEYFAIWSSLRRIGYIQNKKLKNEKQKESQKLTSSSICSAVLLWISPIHGNS